MSTSAGNSSCENCGKRILPTDTVCWHCGWKLPQRSAPVELNLSPTTRETTAIAAEPTQQSDFNLRAIAISGALTLLLIVALLLVMRSLGQRPLLVRSAGTEIGDDWVQLTDSQLRYTLGIPSDWQWLDVPFREQEGLLAELLERRPVIGRLGNPLGTITDLTIEGVGLGAPIIQAPEPAPFVVVATSRQLNQLEPQAVLDLMAEAPVTVLDAHLDSSVPLQPQARFGVFNETLGFQCQNLAVPDTPNSDETGYLVTACAPQSEYAVIERDLASILNSFQLIQQ